MKLALAILVLLAGYQFWWKNRPFKFREVSYVDVTGRQASLKPGGKPSLVLFWISNCGYSDRSLKIMKLVADKYRGEDLDMVGFYLNPATDQELQSLKQVKDYNFIFAGAQQRIDLISTLARDFNPRAGADIYLIDKRGKAHRFDASKTDETINSLFLKLDKLIVKNIPDIRLQTLSNSNREISSMNPSASLQSN